MRNRSILRCLVVGVVSAASVFASAGVASATIDYRERGPLTDTDQHPNICGWPATFSDSGQYQLIVQQTTAGTLHVNYRDILHGSLTFSDSPEVPASLRGVTWQDRNVGVFVFNADVSGDRQVVLERHTSFEGPFKGLLTTATFVVDPSGTVTVDRELSVGDVDCSTFR
jgi:hypothetical protein